MPDVRVDARLKTVLSTVSVLICGGNLGLMRNVDQDSFWTDGHQVDPSLSIDKTDPVLVGCT